MIAVKTKFLPPTNFNGGRIKAYLYNESLICPCNSTDADLKAAKELLEIVLGGGYKHIASFEFGKESVHVFIGTDEIQYLIERLNEK